MMRIAFRKKDGQAEIIRVWSMQERVEIPEQIDGCPVTAVAPYAFSVHKEKAEDEVLFWETGEMEKTAGWGAVSRTEEPDFADGGLLRCGTDIREIHLPKTVQIIGNYAFYGCRNMKVFHGTDRITRMGSGVFTGCRLNRVEIDFYDGDKSCLKEILTDIRYGITAVLRKYQTAEEMAGEEMTAEEISGEEMTAEPHVSVSKIIFPEFYADAVENTPARIVETHYYGSGGDYRECFYRRELDFQKYDSMFVLSAARDQSEVTVELALARLIYPRKLTDKARGNYESYVREHMEEIVEICLEHLENNTSFSIADPVDVLRFCCAHRYFSRETLEAGITKTSEKGQTEVLSILMDERQKHFPRKKKTFDL